MTKYTKRSNEMQFEHTVTNHGMPLYVYTMPSVMCTAVGVLALTGTRDEGEGESGLAHALEHMMFQGNKDKVNSQEISEDIEVNGGNVNAWTSKEGTFYYRTVPNNAFGTAVQSLASQMRAPLFRETDVESEMKNVLEEIKKTQDNPAMLCRKNASRLIFGDHPLGKDILGSVESVSSFTRDSFVSWYNRFYYPANYAVVVVGNITLAEALEEINQHSFGKMGGDLNKREFVGYENPSRTVATEVVERDIDQAHLCFGFPAGSASIKETHALDMYSDMISGGMSYPLFQELRDKRGLCYSVGAGISLFSDKSMFIFQIGTDVQRIDEAVKCIKDVMWSHRADRGLYEKAQKMIAGQNALRFCHPNVILNHTASEILISGSPKSPEEIVKEVQKIKLSTITETVELYFSSDVLSYSYVVPKGANIKA